MIFIINGNWKCQMIFLHLLGCIIQFSPFILLWWCLTLTGLGLLKLSWHPGINHIWLLYTILVMLCWILLVNILSRIFQLYSLERLAYGNLFLWYLVRFCYQINVGFIKWVWKSFLLIHLLEKFDKHYY